MVTHHQAISPLYEEKQYLGYNSLSLLRRLMLTLFCFGLGEHCALFGHLASLALANLCKGHCFLRE